MNIRYVAGLLFLMLAGEQFAFCAEPLVNDKSQGELMPLTGLGSAKENDEQTAQLTDHVRTSVDNELKSIPGLGKLSLTEKQQDQLKRGLGFVGNTDEGKQVVVADKDAIANIGIVAAITGAAFILGPLCYWMYKFRGMLARLQGRVSSDVEMGQITPGR